MPAVAATAESTQAAVAEAPAASPSGAQPKSRETTREELGRALRAEVGDGEADTAAPASETTENATENAEPTEQAEGEEPKREPLAKAWKAYERKKAAIKEREAAVERAKGDFEAQTKAFSDELAFAKRVREMASRDPMSLVRELGLSPQSLTEEMLRAGTPEAEISKIRAELAEERKAVEAQRKAAEEQQARAQAAQEEQHFFSFAKANEERFPDLAIAAERPREVLAKAYEAAQLLRQRGLTPTPEAIALEVNDYYSFIHESVLKRRGQSQNPTTALDTGPLRAARPEATRSPANTITNRGAAESSGKTRKLTDEERRALAIAQIGELRRQTG